MTNKELNTLVALKMNLPKAETKYLQSAFTESFKKSLTDNSIIEFENFGNFEIKKIAEQETLLPESRERRISPPKLVVQFNQSNTLKNKLNLKTQKV